MEEEIFVGFQVGHLLPQAKITMTICMYMACFKFNYWFESQVGSEGGHCWSWGKLGNGF